MWLCFSLDSSFWAGTIFNLCLCHLSSIYIARMDAEIDIGIDAWEDRMDEWKDGVDQNIYHCWVG
jgi:hypothetical protein